jgi:signal transduction histidine kinase
MTDTNSQRILILTDAMESSALRIDFLHSQHYLTTVCETSARVCRELENGAGGLLIAQKALTKEALKCLRKTLSAQPGWSRIPILMILSPGSDGDIEREMLEPFGHVILLEPELSEITFLATMRTAVSLRNSQYDICRLHQELEFSNRAKTDFLANVSHEIRTPLSAILGFSELLMECTLPVAERERYLTIIRRNGRAVSALFDDILNVTQDSSSEVKSHPLDFRVSDLLGDLISTLGGEAAKKGLDFRVERTDDFHKMIRGDLPRIRQVLLHVAGNAIKFTGHGSVVIRVSGDSEHKKLQMEVEDTGIGISKEHAKKLFLPFGQSDTSSTRCYGGVGLGLVLARKLARTLGGDLDLRWSVPGGGSCFAVSFCVHCEVQRSSSSCVAY